MSEVDLSDESARQVAHARYNNALPKAAYLDGCREWRRRAEILTEDLRAENERLRANRWGAFSVDELKCLWPLNNEMVDVEDQLTREIESELARRKARKRESKP